jgi:pimeloyl-ACP methyl ester carboxylesterase
MKSIKLSFVLTLFIALFYSESYAQSTPYSFDVKVSGKGNQSIIFIPGFGCSSEVWNETKINYEKKYTCYTLTMAGFAGISPSTNATFINWEKEIADFIKQNKINKPIIVGHSMGGGLAMAIAADYPELLSKIIIVDALPCLSAVWNTSFKSNENNDCSETVNRMMAVSDDQFYQMQKMMMPQLLADTSKQELVVNWTIKSDRKTFAEMFCDFSNTDLREKIAGITCPTLVLLEPSFANIKPAMNDQYKNLKTAQLVYATKGLHFIMYDDKEWYDNELNKFISK